MSCYKPVSRSLERGVTVMSLGVRKSVAVLAAAVLGVGGMIANTSPAYAASGKVTCGTKPVVGMWINVKDGNSGWASLTSTSDYRTKKWSYDTQGKSWQAHVGCGGSANNWENNIHSGFTNRSSAHITCVDVGYLKTCRIS